MKNYVKVFPTSIYKEIVISLNPDSNLFDIRIAFMKSNAITLFEGSAKSYQINHLSHVKSVPFIAFLAKVDPEITKLIIKGRFQIRTFVQNDTIQKYVIESYGSKYDPLVVVKIDI